ncbi:ATP-grasp domain-containing protein [bacterium]|nr:ATP-grasp domain-containing protein [bacterium]
MKIGLTFDLKSEYIKMGLSPEEAAEFDREETIEEIEKTLQDLGYETERVGHIFALVEALSCGKRWDLVFNIAEGRFGYSRESQIPALLMAYQIPCVFSHPLLLSVAMHKAICKQILINYNIATPKFAVVSKIEDINNVKLEYPLFVKPIAEGTSKGIHPNSKVENFDDLKRACQYVLDEFDQPALVERYLPGREFTVGFVGSGKDTEVIACMEVLVMDKSHAGVYTYEAKEYSEEKVRYELTEDSDAQKAIKVALDAYKALECKDGGRVDVRLNENGEANFIEINPLPGLHYSHSDLPIMASLKGIDFKTLLGKIINSARKRYNI